MSKKNSFASDEHKDEADLSDIESAAVRSDRCSRGITSSVYAAIANALILVAYGYIFGGALVAQLFGLAAPTNSIGPRIVLVISFFIVFIPFSFFALRGLLSAVSAIKNCKSSLAPWSLAICHFLLFLPGLYTLVNLLIGFVFS